MADKHTPPASAKSRAANETHYFSDSLKRKLARLRAFPAAVVEAPSGYGKTTALRDYLAAAAPQSPAVHWFTAVDEAPDASFRRLC